MDIWIVELVNACIFRLQFEVYRMCIKYRFIRKPGAEIDNKYRISDVECGISTVLLIY